jgi:hypothetical protein
MTGGLARFVDEQYRDVIAYRIGVPASGADELTCGIVDTKVGPAVRTGQDLEQERVEVHGRRA